MNDQRMGWMKRSVGHALAGMHLGRAEDRRNFRLRVHPGSVVVVDPSGEHFAATHRDRVALGQRVLVLDPYRVTGEHEYHGALNPMDLIDPYGPRQESAFHMARGIAEMLVAPRADDQWCSPATELLAGLILHCKMSEVVPGFGAEDLAGVREKLMEEQDGVIDTVELMCRSWNPEVRLLAHGLMMKDLGELQGVILRAQVAMESLASAAIAPMLTRSTFGVDVMSGGGTAPTSIYIVTPPGRRDATWLRLMVGTCLEAVLDIAEPSEVYGLFLLDEYSFERSMDVLAKRYPAAAVLQPAWSGGGSAELLFLLVKGMRGLVREASVV